ncbi:hypothetical protein [Lawsonella clevelandensis]|uniref:VG15 protein n=1 Tax=Lawsonella clevelandensis TaxID=1528099 RepID=UPI0011DF78B3|nr:hypothetical protein [Lawsonella clevelandensis]
MRAFELSRISAGVMETLPRPESAWQETPLEQLERTVTWGVRKINGWDALALAQFLGASGSFERNILQQARKTVFHNTQRSGTRYARIPGPYACPFCLMLASRGAVYLTEKSATSKTNGGRFHDSCHCVAIECLTQDDVPSSIHELEQEWNNTAGHVTTGEKDQQRAWTHYLHSSRPYQVRAGHTMKNVMTVRPTPSVLQAPGQMHLYKRGKKSTTVLHRKAISAETLRKAGVVNDGGSWLKEERALVGRLQTRNTAKVQAVEIIGQMRDDDRKKHVLEITGGKQRTPDYIIGDATADLKTLKRLRGKTIDEKILKDLEQSRYQASVAIIDAREYPVEKEELARLLEDRMQEDKVPSEFVILGQYDGREYELVWP